MVASNTIAPLTNPWILQQIRLWRSQVFSPTM
jgi:hypothetical protein